MRAMRPGGCRAGHRPPAPPGWPHHASCAVPPTNPPLLDARPRRGHDRPQGVPSMPPCGNHPHLPDEHPPCGPVLPGFPQPGTVCRDPRPVPLDGHGRHPHAPMRARHGPTPDADCPECGAMPAPGPRPGVRPRHGPHPRHCSRDARPPGSRTGSRCSPRHPAPETGADRPDHWTARPCGASANPRPRSVPDGRPDRAEPAVPPPASRARGDRAPGAGTTRHPDQPRRSASGDHHRNTPCAGRVRKPAGADDGPATGCGQ